MPPIGGNHATHPRMPRPVPTPKLQFLDCSADWRQNPNCWTNGTTGQITGIDSSSGWFKLDSAGKVGWITRKFLTVIPSDPDEPTPAPDGNDLPTVVVGTWNLEHSPTGNSRFSGRHVWRARLGVQQKLMRSANVTTTMNVCGTAMLQSKRQTNSKGVQMVLPAVAAQNNEGRQVAAV